MRSEFGIEADSIFEKLTAISNESIYDSTRLAQPDEVWNFQRGDGIEKAIMLATILKNRDPKSVLEISSDGKTVELKTAEKTYKFQTTKNINCDIQI